MEDYSIAPPPYASWKELNPITKQWIPPVPCPTDGRNYIWDEVIFSWTLLSESIDNI